MRNTLHVNEFSIAYGLLCFGVVFMHLSTIEGGVNPYSLGLSAAWIEQLLHLLFSATVPTFFLLWGYLSSKYLCSTHSALSFFWQKIVHFWPTYIVFALPYLIKDIVEHKIEPHRSGLIYLGDILGFGSYFGAHIMTPLLWSILLLSVLKLCPHRTLLLLIYSIAIFLFLDFIKTDMRLLNGFQFHWAFCAGMLLGSIRFYSLDASSKGLWLGIFFLAISVLSLACQLFNIEFLNIATTNTRWHLPFSIGISWCLLACCRIMLKTIPRKITTIISQVGGAAFAHLVIHIHVMNLIATVGEKTGLPALLTQLLSMALTTVISVFVVYNIYTYGLYRVQTLVHQATAAQWAAQRRA